HDPRRLRRALEIARVDGVELFPVESRRQLARLLATELVQRRIGPALQPVLSIPVRLAMARQHQRCCHARNVVVGASDGIRLRGSRHAHRSLKTPLRGCGLMFHIKPVLLAKWRYPLARIPTLTTSGARTLPARRRWISS